MLRFLRRLWSWIRQRLFGRASQQRPQSAAVAKPQLSDTDYESCLFALIEKVEAGESWAALQAVLIRRRVSAAQLADWLSTFSERWLAEAEAYQVLARQLQQLGEMAALPFGAVAARVGRQLQIERPAVTEEAALPDSIADEQQQIIEQIQAALNEQNFEAAVTIADRYVQEHSQEASAWANKGDLLKALSRYEQAIESYDQAIALQPDDAIAWGNRGLSLDNLGRYEQAIESYDQAIALQPDLAIAWGNRGLSLDNLGRYEQAIESYDQA
ncbi:MAG: tetratricopeptide repeat protein, partial [Phormidesmis sp.]